jgi:hypothetical protein
VPKDFIRDNRAAWNAIHASLEALRLHEAAAGAGVDHLSDTDRRGHEFGIRDYATKLVDKLMK